jgi:Xaa-Pro dipeptidase
MWAGVRFDDHEYLRRHQRLRTLMADAGLDAVLVSDERTTWYLTGFGTDEPIGSPARPRIVVARQDGTLTFLVHRSTATCVAEMLAPGIEVATYARLNPPVMELARELSGAGPAVGADLGGGLRPRLAPDGTRALEEELGHGLTDASALVWNLRAVKSVAEIDRVREACNLTTEAYDLLFDRVTRGTTEAEVARAMLDALTKLGASGGWAHCVSGRGQYDRVDGVPRNRTLAKGDLVFLDAGARVGGYWADFSRAGVIGRPSVHQQERQAQIFDCTDSGIRALMPGTPFAEVSAAIDSAMASHRLEFNTQADRYGHSLGLDVTERPDVSAEAAGLVEEGMILTIEPGTVDEHGIYHCEQDVLVTAEGPEVLSQADWHLRTLG